MSAAAGGPRTDDLVFVYGALRSGTTVFRLMLDAHPRIANPGEMDFLLDALHEDAGAPGGWRYDEDALRRSRIFRASGLVIDPEREGLEQLAGFLDQMRASHADGAEGAVLSINVHRNADRLLRVLPGVRVIHVVRDPRDVARSTIQRGWAGTLYHAVDHWIATEAAWDEAASGIPTDRLLDVSYEGLFEDVEARLRDVCAFLGQPFDPVMLRYHENTTYAAPDPSLVRQWERDCDPRQIALLEHRAGGLMAARGYDPSGPIAPGPAERAVLRLRDRAAVWRFGMRRFGAGTYVAEKATRRLGLVRQNRALRRRMDDVVSTQVK